MSESKGEVKKIYNEEDKTTYSTLFYSYCNYHSIIIEGPPIDIILTLNGDAYFSKENHFTLIDNKTMKIPFETMESQIKINRTSTKDFLITINQPHKIQFISDRLEIKVDLE